MQELPQIVLASGSAYRRELMSRLNIAFECHPPDLDEDVLKKQFHEQKYSPIQIAQELAHAKCQHVARLFPKCIVIGSDQLVEWQDRILGKPLQRERAYTQLKELQGQMHQLITAVSIHSPKGNSDFVNITKLNMRKLTDEEIYRYLDFDEPYDCAGSYKIEELGIGLFEKIDCQDFTAIIGLPLIELAQHLRKLGIPIP